METLRRIWSKDALVAREVFKTNAWIGAFIVIGAFVLIVIQPAPFDGVFPRPALYAYGALGLVLAFAWAMPTPTAALRAQGMAIAILVVGLTYYFTFLFMHPPAHLGIRFTPGVCTLASGWATRLLVAPEGAPSSAQRAAVKTGLVAGAAADAWLLYCFVQLFIGRLSTVH